MKIEKIETWLVSKWLTVRVTCDDGTYGVGEGNFWSYADATEVIAHRIGDDIRGLDPRDVERAIVAHNRQLKWMDGSHRGYMAVELTPGSASSEYRFLSSVREKGAGVSATHRVSARAGSRMLDVG